MPSFPSPCRWRYRVVVSSNCDKKFIPVKVVLNTSYAYLISGDGPPITCSPQRNLRSPAPPVRGFFFRRRSHWSFAAFFWRIIISLESRGRFVPLIGKASIIRQANVGRLYRMLGEREVGRFYLGSAATNAASSGGFDISRKQSPYFVRQ